MPYEIVVLTDGTAVLFLTPDAPQEPESPEAEPPRETPRDAGCPCPSEPRDRTRTGAGPRGAFPALEH